MGLLLFGSFYVVGLWMPGVFELWFFVFLGGVFFYFGFVILVLVWLGGWVLWAVFWFGC